MSYAYKEYDVIYDGDGHYEINTITVLNAVKEIISRAYAKA